MINPVEQAIADIAAGKMVVVLDAQSRENEADLICAAQKTTPELMAFMVRYTSGFICVSLPESDCDRLDLPPMYHHNQDRHGTAYCVTTDVRAGTTTGISAADRAQTIRALANSDSVVDDFNRPGHVVPLRSNAGGVLARPGHTEAAADLAALAGLYPAGALCELVQDDGLMMRGEAAARFAADHDLTLITIDELAAYRRQREQRVTRATSVRFPTRYGDFTAIAYSDENTNSEHLALICGDIADGQDVVTRIHSECLTGDVFGSRRCDCGLQLDSAMTTIATLGRGVVLYMGGHEGRGVGLVAKIRAYALQDEGQDTVDANVSLGLPIDAREYGTCADILRDLGISSVRLLTNNPAKRIGLADYGIDVQEQISLVIAPNSDNIEYLRTKRDRMGHDIAGLENIFQ